MYCNTRQASRKFWSGWLDSNQRQLASRARTLARLSYTQRGLRWLGSNQRPPGYAPGALPLSYAAKSAGYNTFVSGGKRLKTTQLGFCSKALT